MIWTHRGHKRCGLRLSLCAGTVYVCLHILITLLSCCIRQAKSAEGAGAGAIIFIIQSEELSVPEVVVQQLGEHEEMQVDQFNVFIPRHVCTSLHGNHLCNTISA